MKQLEFADFFTWQQEPIEIGVLSITWEDLEEQRGIIIKTDHDDLDTFKYAIIELENGIIYYLHAYQNYQDKSPNKIVVKLQADNLRPKKALHEFVKLLQYDLSIIEWMNPHFVDGTVWQIKMKNGNDKEFIVSNALDEIHADLLVESSCKKYPEYSYWYEKYTFEN
ncbi:hypothetical protein [Leptospira interrogans]|uniref:hypothetical protein n=1 Tax=Leptospira interrogans TaxID=173 RepID=UPI000773F7E8|nr:hypothetical protein [Leptospira interrogans]